MVKLSNEQFELPIPNNDGDKIDGFKSYLSVLSKDDLFMLHSIITESVEESLEELSLEING